MPVGTTGKDANGNWTKVENGMTVVWNVELNIWERHLNLNDQGIPLIVWTQNDHNVGAHDQVFLIVRVDDGMQGVEKIDSISLHPGANIDDEPGGHPLNFSNVFLGDVLKEYQGQFNTFNVRWFDEGKISFSFTTSERQEPWSWKLGPNTSVIVDILDAPIGNGFVKEHGLGVFDGIDGPDQTRYQLRVFTDSEGNLHEWIVPGKPVDQLTKEQLLEMYLYAPTFLTQSSDFRTDLGSNRLTFYVDVLTKPAFPPFIDFGPPQ